MCNGEYLQLFILSKVVFINCAGHDSFKSVRRNGFFAGSPGTTWRSLVVVMDLSASLGSLV